MARDTDRDALPTWSAHTLVMTLLEGPDHFNGHCTCDRWSYRTDDWDDLGTRWAWHYVAESGGDCAGCGYPVIKGRTHCRTCEDAAVEDGHGDNCECNCCWEATVARRHARDLAHQRVACRNCGLCLDCEDPASPDHDDCSCPLGQAIPVEVAA